MELNDIKAKAIKWDCRHKFNRAHHLMKNNKVRITTNFEFVRRHFITTRILETMIVPAGTVAYVKNTWRNEDYGTCFVNLITENGVCLYDIPYYRVEFVDEVTPFEMVRDSLKELIRNGATEVSQTEFWKSVGDIDCLTKEVLAYRLKAAGLSNAHGKDHQRMYDLTKFDMAAFEKDRPEHEKEFDADIKNFEKIE
jgi:hypothetical protein